MGEYLWVFGCAGFFSCAVAEVSSAVPARGVVACSPVSCCGWSPGEAMLFVPSPVERRAMRSLSGFPDPGSSALHPLALILAAWLRRSGRSLA